MYVSEYDTIVCDFEDCDSSINYHYVGTPAMRGWKNLLNGRHHCPKHNYDIIARFLRDAGYKT